MMNRTHGLDALYQDEPPLVRVRDVGKIFCVDLKRSLLYGLGDGFGELLARRSARKSAADGSQALRRGEFWANRGITFELKRGECLGLIGRNGAGKTTLLKMLNGLIKPDEGIIEMRGRVGAIIALGAGFNPLLTGRENVYVNASLLGLSKREIDEKFEEIVDFAEIGTFIDAPVQSYSSGMQVRLGFAIATSTEPDVLLLDEVLAVGDHSFQSKCMARISSLIGRCAVIFVSHQEHLVQRLCDRVLWLSQGRAIADGQTREILARYLDSGEDHSTSIPSASLHSNIASASAVMSRREIHSGDDLEVLLEVNVLSSDSLEEIFICLIDGTGKYVCRATMLLRHSMTTAVSTRFDLKVRDLRLKSGTYLVQVLAFKDGGKTQLLDLHCTERVRISSPWISKVEYQPHLDLKVLE